MTEEITPHQLVGALSCSFCRRPQQEAGKLVVGHNVFICAGCVKWCLGQLEAAPVAAETRFERTHQLIAWHLVGLPAEAIVTSKRIFPARMRADLQLALEESFSQRAKKMVGVHGGYSHETLSFSQLLETGNYSKLVGPLEYEEVEIGEDRPIKCLRNALWAMESNGARWMVLLSRELEYGRVAGMQIEIAGASGEATAKLAEEAFGHLEAAIQRASSYRGKVLSLERQDQFSGKSNAILVHQLRRVGREDLVLPERTIATLERGVIEFAAQREQLKRLGLPTKKGFLFYGPPGTGKTHTVQFLASHLPGHTTLLVTAEQVGLISEYMVLARLLQPSILVIEDADLIARERTQMGLPIEEVLLNKLLNEMDGLRPDADIFFILTTNRPSALEPALADRPGRVDQGIEFPLPDREGRTRLAQLYASGIALAGDVLSEIVNRTEGVSGAFIKELMRRSAQYMLAENGKTAFAIKHVRLALEEMLSGGALDASLAGASISMKKFEPAASTIRKNYGHRKSRRSK
ncbi:MAG: AAA family ATPase [Burkholderiales bacterium]